MNVEKALALVSKHLERANKIAIAQLKEERTQTALLAEMRDLLASTEYDEEPDEDDQAEPEAPRPKLVEAPPPPRRGKGSDKAG